MPASYTHSADYIHIDEALKDEWASFLELDKEMHDFEPLPLEHFKELEQNWLAHLKNLNPDKSELELMASVKTQVDFQSSPGTQFWQKFERRNWGQNIKVTFIAHALCEALINAVLAIGLSHVGATDLFQLLERNDLKQKWVHGPKSFFPGYSFPIGSAMHETLVSLIKHRNSLVHYKIELTVEDKKVLDGTKIRRSTYEEDRAWLRRYFSLPYDLSDYIFKNINEPKLILLYQRGPIERAKAHAA